MLFRSNAALQVIRSAQVAVEANELAVEGVRAENTVVTRNVLDVLNAEQELLNSRVQLATAERDAYVAGFTLLAAMGRAEARDLDLFGGTLFAPGFSRKAVPGPVSPRIDSAPSPGARIEFTPDPAATHPDYTPPSPP